ncbi:hypothetical protein GTP38_12045 [Duganella sp. FT94W]|uniref:HTH luxR-type domain-containing protein n=1 Tax=Duganella lactea TaxID=2692173 RepID=A0ABW9V8J1_9BURK|nr:helix-turn-helix transcriptional regulator [Duganella lactea]MYM35065.1 hypothetical protein [Duganella lactea]
MDDYNTLLLDIYHAARTLPADEFPAVLMAMLRVAVGFDFARMLRADISSGAVVVHGCIMDNIPTDNALDWETIQRQDVVLPHVLAHPGKPVSFHCGTLFAAPPHAIMRDYVQRYEHRNGLAVMLPDAETGLVDGLSLYRAHDAAHFGLRQKQLVQWLMPHLQEALKLNRQLAMPTDLPPAHGALLIAEANGAIQHCAASALALMVAEWPGWHAVRLPTALLEALRRTGVDRYTGKHLVAHCQRYRTLLFLRVTARSPLMQLSRRELQVAGLYGQGMRAKAVAKALNITPATARNTLQRVYLKLDVHDKAALAVLLRQPQ